MVKVLVAAQEGEQYFDLLNDIPGVEIVRAAPSAALEQAGDAEVFFGFPSRELLLAAPKLRWIQSPSAGVDYLFRLPELRDSDIILTNARGAHGPSIGEHVFALLLALTRGIPVDLSWQRQHHWGHDEAYRTLTEIRGATLGIIGYGSIGRAVARRARGFEMEVLALDSHPVLAEPYVNEVLSPRNLDDLLRASDVVVVAAPYTPQIHHLLDAAALAKLRPGAHLIVVSRGGIVDEAALVDALRSGRLAGAALDVTEQEPLPPDSPLWEAPNLIITPHVAGASAQKERRVVEIFRDNLIRYLHHEPLRNLVDKERGY